MGRAERLASCVILAILAAIGVGVWRSQSRLNPAVLVAHEAPPQSATHAGTADASDQLPASLQPLSPPEAFNPDNLYDKIDGKAELYLAAGFNGMHCQRFALKGTPDQWFEWFVYEMTGAPGAFSVFSTQRRGEGEPLKLTPFAYRTQNAVYFACGSNYVEAVASSTNGTLINAALEMAASFLARTPTTPIRELELFPPSDLIANSQTLQVADGFGFDGLKNVFTARYRIAGAEVTAFVSACPDAAEAARVCDAYAAFLLSNGGKASPNAPAGQKTIEIMGGTEIIFAQGIFLGGVHSASVLESAQVMAQRLRERLAR